MAAYQFLEQEQSERVIEISKVVIQTSVTEQSIRQENVATEITTETQSLIEVVQICRQLKSTAEEANRATRDAIGKLKLSSVEKQRMDEIQDFDSFLQFVNNIERKSFAEKKGSFGTSFQQHVAEMKSFADAYSELFHAISDAVPFGAGNLTFGVCGILLSVVSKKVEREETIRKSLVQVTKTLPRLKQYGDVYKKSARMTEALVQLHQKVISFLCEAFLYCKDRGARGSFFRYKKALSPFDNIMSLVDDINTISRDIFHEGMMELSSEVRSITLSMKIAENNQSKTLKELKETKRELERANQIILDLNQKATEANNWSIGVDLQRIKGHFVDPKYDPVRLFEHTRDQILQSSASEALKQSYRQTLESEFLSNWLYSDIGLASPDTSPIIWVTSGPSYSSAISHMTLMALERLLAKNGRLPGFSQAQAHKIQGSLIIYSPYQTGLSTSILQDESRTAYTLFLEAIYQLILHYPHLIREHEELQDICYRAQSDRLSQFSGNGANVKRLANLFRDLVQLVFTKLNVANSTTKSDGATEKSEKFGYAAPVSTPSIYWIIDRIDTAEWLRSGTPRKSRSRGVSNPTVSELSEFARAVEIVTGSPKDSQRSRNRRKGNDRDGASPKPSFKVLITSAYPPYHLDEKWVENKYEDDDSYSSSDGDGIPEFQFMRPGWTEMPMENIADD